ncbi:neoverrucotoxin subunit alpha-like [Sander lucioperca]|uniref:neoverrucotoxin subunit alpha-like n=1 Tax=Sander lucioperca TaxID=283035 RepID=UPI00125E8656|nr:neoverrucotoxin subunit alpha-like [Sander lucioperca]
MVTRVEEEQQPYPDHPEMFDDCRQLLCKDGLTGRCYWEVDRRGGGVSIAVCYRGINRRGDSDSRFSCNDQSWSLESSGGCYYVCHNYSRTDFPLSSSSVSTKVGVYMDCPAGSLSFYAVSSDTLIHLHTFNTTFTEPLYPGFGFWVSGASMSLCSL